MTRERSMSQSSGPRRARSVRTARLLAGGFIGAFGATILTVISTGLHVGAPRGPKMGNTVAAPPRAHVAAQDKVGAVQRNDVKAAAERERERDDGSGARDADDQHEPSR